MTEPLPERASLDWLRKTAKQNLRHLRLQHPEAKLADAQRELARAYGFTSWRALKAQVDRTPDAPPDEIEISAFLRAVGNGEIESVRAALAAKPVLVNAAGPHPFWGGRPQALHVAIEAGRRDLFDLLIDAGADVNGRNQDYDQWSPIMLTCSRNREDMRETLLQRNARVGLVEAMMMADDGAVAALLKKGRDTLPEAPNRGSLLAFARTPFAIDRLLELGVSPDQKDHWGTAPIEAMSRLGARGRALVSHMIARGSRRRRIMRARDRMLAALIEGTRPCPVPCGVMGRRRFSPTTCPLAARPRRRCERVRTRRHSAPFRRLERRPRNGAAAVDQTRTPCPRRAI